MLRGDRLKLDLSASGFGKIFVVNGVLIAGIELRSKVCPLNLIAADGVANDLVLENSMAGLRLVTRSGGTPGTGALLIRNIFRLIDALPSLYLLGLLCCFATAQRVRIGDMAAGTLLVVDTGARGASLSHLGTAVGQTGLAPRAVELIQELLERWDSLELERRGELSRALLARMQGTDRSAPQLASLSDAELRLRLLQLMRDTEVVTHG